MEIQQFTVPARYRRRLGERYLLDVVDEIGEVLERIRAEAPGLLRRAKSETADGYPISTRGGSGGGGADIKLTSVEAAASIRMEEGGDAVRDLAVGMCTAVLVARDAARAALGAWERSVPASAPCWKCGAALIVTDTHCRSCDSPATEPGVAGCVVHARYELYVPARARGRCRWCNDWSAAWLEEHNEVRDPPEHEIRALEDKRVERDMRRAA